jgi:quinolinate synthase
MAMTALQGVDEALEPGRGEITVPEPTRSEALGCIERMLDFVARNPGATQKPGLVRHIGAA